MFYLFALICTINHIPDEFKEIMERAIRSAKIRQLSNLKPEPIISPSKPFKADSFVGTVLNPVFGATVKELKGFAISNTKQHIALIVDRESEDGLSILKENSVFLGENNISVSLSHKFADDGEVAIFNLTEIDPLSVFNNFDLSLSSLTYGCKANFGNDLGGRCHANLTVNYDVDAKKPLEITIPDEDLAEAVRDRIQFYGGVNAEAYASVTVKRRGMSISAEFNGGFDVIGGAGFHIKKIDTPLNISKEIIIAKPKEIELGKTTISIFGASVNLNAKLFASVVARDINLLIPHDVTIMRQIKIHLNKGFTVSTKHSFTSDLEKKVQVSKIDTEANQIGNSLDDYLEAEFSGEFVLRAGIKVALSVNTAVDFAAELGPEVGMSLTIGCEPTKCVFPGLYGQFSPFVRSFLHLSGKLSIASIKLIDIETNWINEIYKTTLSAGNCFFDSSSSTELDKNLLTMPTIKRSILQVYNPTFSGDHNAIFDNNCFGLTLLGGSGETYKGYIGTGFISLAQQEKSQTNHYYVIPEAKNYDIIYAIASTKESEYTSSASYPFESVQMFDMNDISFLCESIQSQPILMGNQFSIADLNGFYNFRPKYMSALKNRETIRLIIHTKQDGYICDCFKYLITDEIYDEVYDYMYNWFKFTIKNIQNPKECTLSFYSESYSKILGIQTYIQDEDGSIQPLFDDFSFLVRKSDNMKQSDDIFIIGVIIGSELVDTAIVKYSDIIKSTDFTISVSDLLITFTSENTIESVEYILKLNEDYTKSIEGITDIDVKAIVARSSFTDDDKSYYKGVPIGSSLSMESNEMYGIFEFVFDDNGYDLPNNDKVYAFFKLENAEPLSESRVTVDETEGLYVVKLEIGKCVSSFPPYLFSIPFRRTSSAKATINCMLYSIYQSFENNPNNDPFCPDFPSFNMKPDSKFYAGCIRTYVDSQDKTENEWDHYPEQYPMNSIDYPDGTVSDRSFSRLHQISFKETIPTTEESETIKIVAKQKYFNFPLTSRTMIIEDNTVAKFREFAKDESIRISCRRCSDIYKNSFLDGDKIYKSLSVFEIPINDDTTEGFTLQAMCKSEDEDNERTFCVFAYDIKDDGYTLLDYQPSSNDPFEDNSRNLILEEKVEGETKQSVYPGVEELYDIENDTIPKFRLNMNCKRQVIPPRTDSFYLTKPWPGKIVKLATHLEEGKMDIDVVVTMNTDFVEIKLEGKGFKERNPNLDDTQIIPFNPVFFIENEEQFKILLDQVGVINFNSKHDVSENNYVEVDDDGKLIVKKNNFDKEKLQNSVKNNKIDLIAIPSNNYQLSYNEIDNSEEPTKKKLGAGAIAGIVIAAVVVVVAVIIVIIYCTRGGFDLPSN